MDSTTHVAFAAQLLRLSGGDPAYAVVSLFPQIDRNPPTLHRMYAHTVFQARELAEIGLQRLAATPPDAATMAAMASRNGFATRRFSEEQARILSYQHEPQWSSTAMNDHVLLAYVSHLYLDTYNQPTQPFAPRSVYCSGQWTLWQALGEFRLRLYTTGIIDALRAELFDDHWWHGAPKLSAAALTSAMMVRMCSFGLDRLPPTLVQAGQAALNLAPEPPAAVDEAEAFLRAFEARLDALHRRHLLAPAARPAAALVD